MKIGQQKYVKYITQVGIERAEPISQLKRKKINKNAMYTQIVDSWKQGNY